MTQQSGLGRHPEGPTQKDPRTFLRQIPEEPQELNNLTTDQPLLEGDAPAKGTLPFITQNSNMNTSAHYPCAKAKDL